jgi:hypothetical protein
MSLRPGGRRKLLVASIGVATVSYVVATASCGGTTSAGPSVTPENDASQSADVEQDQTSPPGDEFEIPVGNLMPFPFDAASSSGGDATKDAPADEGAPVDAADEFHQIVGNLVAPPIDP